MKDLRTVTEAKKKRAAQSKGSEKTRKNGKKKTKKSRLKRWILGIFLFLLFVVIACAALFFVAYARTEVPRPEQLVNKQISYIYASDNTTELGRVVPPEGNRVQVSLDEIPEALQKAVIAAEDREFETNSGFSFTGFARAALGQLTGDDSKGGGSTITQQYVKNAVVGNEHSYRRKARELIVSLKMAREWSKDDVLEAYLNTIYFGRNAYGVSAAAQAYFGKPLEDLTTAESAVLAALIQRPSALDPWTNREEAEARWNYVLDGMVDMGNLSAEERATMVYPDVIDPALAQTGDDSSGPNGLITTQVLAELQELGFTEEDINTRGLRVTTTIDMTAQNSAVDAVRTTLDRDEQRAAVVSIEPTTGAIRAYYGGEDGTGWDYANNPVQTGSTFKIFGLAAALQQDIPLSTMVSSAPYQSGDVTVTNSEGMTCGTCSIAQALKLSLNTSFLRLQDMLANKTQDTADMAHALGVAESLPTIEKTLSSNGGAPENGVIIGQYESRPMDMAIGLSTLADGGVWHKEHFVQSVTSADGDVLYTWDTSDVGERRVDQDVAEGVLYAMRPIAAYSNNNDLAGGRQSASKTGTSQLGDTGYNKDAWMIGATPQLSTAVWVGTVDNTKLVNAWGGSVYGAGLPATIWKDTMDGALVNAPLEVFPDPEPGDIGYYTQSYGGYGTSTSTNTGGTGATTDTAPGTDTGGAEAPVEPAAPEPAAPAGTGLFDGWDLSKLFG